MTNGQIQILCLVLIRQIAPLVDLLVDILRRNGNIGRGVHVASQKVDDNVHSLDIVHVSAPGTLWLVQNVLLVRSYSSSCSWGSDFNKEKVKKSNLIKNVG